MTIPHPLRVLISAVVSVAVISAFLAVSTLSSTTVHAQVGGDPLGPTPNPGETICYAIEEGPGAPNELVIIRDALTAPTYVYAGDVAGGTAAQIEALAIRPGSGIYVYDPATNGGELMIISAADGSVVSVVGTNLGMAISTDSPSPTSTTTIQRTTSCGPSFDSTVGRKTRLFSSASSMAPSSTHLSRSKPMSSGCSVMSMTLLGIQSVGCSTEWSAALV